jgi:sorbitol-specific phosphotransferase system component IIA
MYMMNTETKITTRGRTVRNGFDQSLMIGFQLSSPGEVRRMSAFWDKADIAANPQDL